MFSVKKFGMKMQFLILFVLLLFAFKEYGEGSPAVLRYNNNSINGGITYTGNTLGLSKKADENNPGTKHGIGAFITTNMLSKVNDYDYGTTLNWQDNGSTAYLDLPSGSTVVYAELIWGGSYGVGGQITGNEPDSNINFVTPDNVSHSVAITPATSSSVPLSSGSSEGYYVRSADVTSLVAPFGAGYYTAGGIAATVAASDNNTNCGGWALAVAYENPNMNTKSLSIWVFLSLVRENQPVDIVSLTGFVTPPTGSIEGLLYAASLEGDAVITGDRFLFSDTNPPVSPGDSVSGSNNPINNFFCSQINTLVSYSIDGNGKIVASPTSLDTRGSFGLVNSNPFTGKNVTGGRQGYDVTSVDISSMLVNNQTTAYIKGTTSGDSYAIQSVALDIQVDAPIIAMTKLVNGATTINANLTDVVTFSFSISNNGTANATSVVFKDILETGLTFVSGTFTVNSVVQPDPNLVTGYSLPNLNVGSTTTISFQASVDAAPISGSTFHNYSILDYQYTPSGGSPVNGTANSNQVSINLPSGQLPGANDDSVTTVANTQYNQNISVLNNDTGVGILVTSINTTSTLGTVVMNFSSDPSINGTYQYSPPTGYSGLDSFAYTITDAFSNTASATVHVTVLPQAVSDTGYSVTANTTLTNASSVLTNDIGTGLSVSTYDTTTVLGGTVTMNTTTGTFNYTPPLNTSGEDEFNYTAIDSTGNTSVATVTIIVLPVAEDDFGTTPANTPLNGTTVFTNDIGTGLTMISYQNPSAQGGVVNMNMLTGVYVYTPPTGFSGEDTFTYTVQDRFGSIVVATVHITVRPVAVDDTATVVAGSILNGPSVLLNDIGTGLTIDLNYASSPSVAGGIVTMNLNGTYTYVPPANFSGTDHFMYQLIDQANHTDIGKVVITVLPFAADYTYQTLVNVPVTGISVFTDSIGTNLVVSSPVNTPSTQGGTIVMDQQTGIFVYTPPSGFSGVDTFQYTIIDLSGQTATGTVSITVGTVSGPRNFVGNLYKCKYLNKTEYCLDATWQRSRFDGVTSYRIYFKNKLVETVPASGPFVFKTCLSNPALAKRYKITAVDSTGSESKPVRIKVIYKY